ncbi:MAG: hypothetical protein JWN24_2930 [Phycisphaerales bacterium]|nr:hypothetical protein [Phycisphaerales bacterium]
MRHAFSHAAMIFALLLLSTPARSDPAPPPAAPNPPQTGQFQVKFTERSPSSALDKLAHRLGWTLDTLKKEGVELEYDLAKESFEVYIPADYDGSKKYGLFVWVSASPSGVVHQQWLEQLDKRHLIWVGANNAGNPRAVTARLGLAIDAVHNMKAKYAIDDDRIYVSGGSGGGRCSSILGVSHPDIFRGGFYMIGCDYFRIIPTGEPSKFWQRSYGPPEPKMMALAAHHSRHVLLTGENDMNRAQTKGNYERGFLKDGFEHVLYLEVPGMGHQPPPADWFEKGLAFLDERPAAVAASQPAERAIPVAGAPNDPNADAADKLLRMAKLYARNNRADQARVQLQKLIDAYPNSPASAEAKKLLAELGKQ